MEEYVERLGDDTLALEVQTLFRLDKESPPFPLLMLPSIH